MCWCSDNGLKGQKLLTLGNALNTMERNGKTPRRGKSEIMPSDSFIVSLSTIQRINNSTNKQFNNQHQ